MDWGWNEFHKDISFKKHLVLCAVMICELSWQWYNTRRKLQQTWMPALSPWQQDLYYYPQNQMAMVSFCFVFSSVTNVIIQFYFKLDKLLNLCIREKWASVRNSTVPKPVGKYFSSPNTEYSVSFSEKRFSLQNLWTRIQELHWGEKIIAS